MMVDINAGIVCDSIGEHSPRLTTFLTRYPKFIHAEHCRHRAMSLCVSSSRAVPVAKNLEEVRSEELRAGPVWWGREQKGMVAADELSDYDLCERDGYAGVTDKGYAQIQWRIAAYHAANQAELMMSIGAHKSIVNRLLEPFLHVNVLVTVCEPGLLNFFGLRLDKAAQPEIRTLAEAMWEAWNESTPRKLASGEWHLPFIDNETWGQLQPIYEDRMSMQEITETVCTKISAARCARLSYTSFETGKRSTVEEDFTLYVRLLSAVPIHASPAEHQATPDAISGPIGHLTTPLEWSHPELHGNLPGWIQHRKLLPGEACAPLPKGYQCR